MKRERVQSDGFAGALLVDGGNEASAMTQNDEF
jgi:hypothetical protein